MARLTREISLTVSYGYGEYMNNPWKSRSQINPQRDEGTRQISNEVYRALMKAPLTIGEMKVALCIIDKTWGFNKASDIISVGQMSTATNLGDRGIRKIFTSLKEKRIICYQESNKRLNRGSPINEFLFNKHHDTWVFKGGTVVHALNSGSVKPEQPFRESLNGGSSTKETLTKESIKEIDIESPQVEDKKPSKKKTTKKLPTNPPKAETFKPNKATKNLCRELNIGQKKFKLLAASCFDHFLGVGKRRADWQATLRNWIRKAADYEEKNANNNPPSPGGGYDTTRRAL